MKARAAVALGLGPDLAAMPPDAKNTPENIEPASTMAKIIAVIDTVCSAA